MAVEASLLLRHTHVYVSMHAICLYAVLQDHMIRAFDTTNSRALNFHEFQRLHYFLVNVQGSFQQFDRWVRDNSRSRRIHGHSTASRHV